MSNDRLLTHSVLAALLTGAAVPAFAAPTLDPMLGDHAVLQRDQTLRITGSASPGEQLIVSLAGSSAKARADRAGRWFADLPPLSAGGPYTLQVQGGNGSRAAAQDILIGDVWLCSGQSNMEYPISRALNGPSEAAAANDPQMRIVTIAKDTAVAPSTAFKETPRWSAITPQNAGEFSAACYFMARELRKTQKVPIGAIDSTWGGTPIRAWMSLASLRSSGGSDAANLVELYRKDPAAAERNFGEVWNDWWRNRTGNAAGQEPWRNSGSVAWKPMPAFDIIDNWDAGLSDWNGAFWARRTIVLTPEEARQGAVLSLGVIDDMDRTYVNGTGVGVTNDPSNPRNYKLAPGTLRSGENEILVYIRDAWAQGGFRGPADVARLTLANGQFKPIGSDWQYALIDDSVGSPPSAPWEGNNGASTIYNAMIAPLGPTSLKGVAWYQGESDVGQPGYDRRLAGMFGNWRQQFRNPDLPFLIVGLAAFGTPKSTASESGWAQLVDEQRKAVAADRSAAFVPAIDLGEWYDIHPANKLDVGKRLAMAARSVAYRDPNAQLSPLPLSAARSGSNVAVTFSKPLQTLSGASAIGFELCGQAQGSCRFREAQVTGNQLIVLGDGLPATRVRFAWAEAPVVNLYDHDLLPASSFELPIN